MPLHRPNPCSPAPAPLDIVTLKDGSVIYGEVLEMAGGILFLKNPSSPDNMIKLKWEDVTQLSVNHPIPFHLKEGTILNGTATRDRMKCRTFKWMSSKDRWHVPMSST